MKCPKCGYISFDYNEVCPKCNKDITVEQQKLNLPSFKPAPPFLLGALTGELEESDSSLKIDLSQGEEPVQTDADVISLEDLEEIPTEESAYEEVQDMASAVGTEEPAKFEETEELITLEDLSEPEPEPITPVEPSQDQRERELTIDLDDIYLDNSTDKGASITETPQPSLDEISVEEEKSKASQERNEEIELDIDAVILEEEDSSRSNGAANEEQVLDLDNLELELDLDDSDQKTT